jgi:hypothetical protein
MQLIFLLLCCLLGSSHVSAQDKVTVSYIAPANPEQAAVKRQLQQANDIDDAFKLINTLFRLDDKLTIVFGEQMSSGYLLV